jgi:hypothetical protein
MKTVKSGLRSLCAQMKMEDLLSDKRKAKRRKDKSGKAHTFTQDTNSKAQKGSGAGGAAWLLPTSSHVIETYFSRDFRQLDHFFLEFEFSTFQLLLPVYNTVAAHEPL